MVRPWLYVTRDHGDGNPVTRVMGDSRSRVMGNPVTMEIWAMEKTRVIDPIIQWPCDPVRPVTMWPLWPMVTRNPGSLWPGKTRDRRPWYKGGGRYGVWRYIYGRNMVIPPHARRRQYGAGWWGAGVIHLHTSTTTLHPSTLYILIY